MSTTDPIVPSADPSTGTPRPRRRGRIAGVVLSVAGVLAIVFLVTMSFVASGKVAFRPGSATPAQERVEVQGATTYDPEGDILFLTVKVDRLSKLERWYAEHFEHDVDIVDEKLVFGDQTPQQNRQFNQQLMTQAKSNAELAALEYLGYDAFESTGALIVQTTDDGPARSALNPGDVVVGIDGTVVRAGADLVRVLRASSPGAVVTLDVEPRGGGARTTVPVTLVARPDGQPGGYLGVQADDRVVEKPLPLQISIDSGRVGGDSAGLAFTLSIIDDLTKGELTGDHRVAVTGTISRDGRVGEVGGIKQKVVAAKKAKAELMIVPASLADEARAGAGALRVVGVSTLQEALDALSSLGGNAAEAAMSARQPTN